MKEKMREEIYPFFLLLQTYSIMLLMNFPVELSKPLWLYIF